MRKISKLLIAITLGVLTTGCASEKILRAGDKFNGYELRTAWSGQICDKQYYDVSFRKNYEPFSAEMNPDGIGNIRLEGTNYNIRFVDSKVPEKRGVIMTPSKN